ncbi:hypothetical protein [Cohnella cellulosilytica]|uniref:Tissue inhibitor of metalloproteinase n=1 Tax=Cohnella cellulosilytica TaxID=986710 RepID=A0ABW2F8M4_9BACL
MLTFVAGAIAVPGKAYACSCAPTPSVEEELSRKTAVFSGTVTKVVKPENKEINSSADPVEVTFDVEKVWKGDLDKQTKVYTAVGEESCGYVNFVQGAKYIVSAYGSSERLETGVCELTKPIEQAEEAVEKLGAGSEPNEGSKPDDAVEKVRTGNDPDNAVEKVRTRNDSGDEVEKVPTGSGEPGDAVEKLGAGSELGGEGGGDGNPVWPWVVALAAGGGVGLVIVRTRMKRKGGE